MEIEKGNSEPWCLGATDLGVPAFPVRGRVSSVDLIPDGTMGGLCVHEYRLLSLVVRGCTI